MGHLTQSEFGIWQEENEDNLWAAYNETNAIAEGADYDDFCESEYDNFIMSKGSKFSFDF